MATKRFWPRQCLWFLCWLCCAVKALADGMVVPDTFSPKVQIPNQQALIHYSDGVEHLVIETSFLGAGTNFAWVVPLPSAPEVKPVSESFFPALQGAFQPQLIHRVRPYWAGILLVCGLVVLGSRCLKQEISPVVDLPLCLLLSVGAGVLGGHYWFGILAMVLALCIRLFARSPATFALMLVIGTAYVSLLTFRPFSHFLGLIETMGDAAPGEETVAVAVAGVTVLSTQRAGVFESTTIQGANPGAVRSWLKQNGYLMSESAQGAIRDYVQLGWVFVASKVRRPEARTELSALHPLAFIFPVRAPVYPTKLTAVDNGDCIMDLFVFGTRRATAHHFEAVRCDRVSNGQPHQKSPTTSALRITDPEVLSIIGNSTVGTKLSGRLSPAQMAKDVEIQSSFFSRTGVWVFSRSGALAMALNLALPLAALTWLLLGTSRGAWGVSDVWVSRWRWRVLAAALSLGVALFLLAPKVEVQAVNLPVFRGLNDE